MATAETENSVQTMQNEIEELRRSNSRLEQRYYKGDHAEIEEENLL